MFMHVHMCLDTLCTCVSRYGDRLMLGIFLIVFLLLYWGSLLRLLCDGWQAGCHILPAFTWVPGSTLRLSILCSQRKPWVGQRHSLQGAQGETVLPTAERHSSHVNSRIDTCKWQVSLSAIINLLHGLFHGQGQTLAIYNFSCRKQNIICNKNFPIIN